MDLATRVLGGAGLAPLVRRGSMSFWGSIAALVVASSLLLILFVRHSVGSAFTDFHVYHNGASAIRQGNPLYELALAWRDAGYADFHPTATLTTTTEPLDRNAGVHSIPYNYPAGFAFAFLPFTFIPKDVGRLIWFTIVFACLVGAAYVLVGTFFKGPRAQRMAGATGLSVLMALFQPTRASLYQGQVECILLFFLALSFSAFVRGRDYRAGWWLALAMIVKPFLGFLVLFFLWKRSYRAAISACVCGAILFLGPALILGPGVLFDFLAVAAYWSTPEFLASPFNQSVYGLLLRLLTPNAFTVPMVDAQFLVEVSRWTLTGISLLILAVSVSRSRAVTVSQLGLEFGLTIVIMLLVAPLAEDIHYTHLLIPLVAFVAALKHSWSLAPMTVAIAAMTAAVYGYLSLPGLRLTAMASYSFYDSQVSGIDVLLTGAQVYGLACMAIMAYAAVRWYRAERFATTQPGRHAVAAVESGV